MRIPIKLLSNISSYLTFRQCVFCHCLPNRCDEDSHASQVQVQYQSTSTYLIRIHLPLLSMSKNMMNLFRTTDDKTLKVALGIYRKEGIRGLWRGVGPTSQRSGLLAGVQVSRTDDMEGGLDVIVQWMMMVVWMLHSPYIVHRQGLPCKALLFHLPSCQRMTSQRKGSNRWVLMRCLQIP